MEQLHDPANEPEVLAARAYRRRSIWTFVGIGLLGVLAWIVWDIIHYTPGDRAWRFGGISIYLAIGFGVMKLLQPSWRRQLAKRYSTTEEKIKKVALGDL